MQESTKYTLLTLLVIIAGVITGVWLSHSKTISLDPAREQIEPTMSDTAPVNGDGKQVPIYFVETNDKKLAISFDAAWGAEHTQTILDTLAQHNVTATFFLTDIWLDEYPDMAKTIADAGHEIGMHSVTHPHMPQLTPEQMQKELMGNHQTILETTNFDAELFRFPFGDYDNQSINIVRQNEFYPVQWSIDSLDWQESKTTDDIVTRVTMGLHPGAIILCHNNGAHTAEAIAQIIPYAIEKGYTFVPIGELIYKGDYTTDHQGMQRAAQPNPLQETEGL